MKKADSIPLLLERFGRIVQNDAHREGLKPTQWEALRFLARANRFSRSPRAVTAYLGMTKGTVSQTLNALETKGLIRKISESADRRSLRLELTPLGLRMLEQDPLLELETALEGLSGRNREAITQLLEGVLTGMLERRGGKPFGVCKTCRHFRKKADAGEPHFCNLLKLPLTKTDSKQICVEQEAA